MPKRLDPESVATFFEKLPKKAGTPEERLAATAKYFKVKPVTVKNALKFWWPGSKFMKEFPRTGAGPGKARWDMPTDTLLEALNKHGSVFKTAKALKTTPITLSKVIKRKGIVQRWVSTSAN